MSGEILFLLLAVYTGLALLLPIYKADRYMRRHGQPVIKRLGMAIAGLIGGCLGLAGVVVLVIILPALRPADHDPIDLWGWEYALFLGLLLGVPIGTWAAAWGSARLATRLSKR